MKKRLLHGNVKYSSGFTLIELLVVIAIISLLVSILLPNLNLAKKEARKIVCATGLRTIAYSLLLYADDYSGQLPHKGHAAYPQSVLYYGVQQFNDTGYYPDYISDYRSWYCPERDLAEKMDLDQRWKMGELYYLYVPGYIKHNGSYNIFEAQSQDVLACDAIADYLSLFIANHSKKAGGRYANFEDALGANISHVDGSVSWNKFDDLTLTEIGPYGFWF